MSHTDTYGHIQTYRSHTDTYVPYLHASEEIATEIETESKSESRTETGSETETHMRDRDTCERQRHI